MSVPVSFRWWQNCKFTPTIQILHTTTMQYFRNCPYAIVKGLSSMFSIKAYISVQMHMFGFWIVPTRDKLLPVRPQSPAPCPRLCSQKQSQTDTQLKKTEYPPQKYSTPNSRIFYTHRKNHLHRNKKKSRPTSKILKNTPHKSILGKYKDKDRPRHRLNSSYFSEGLFENYPVETLSLHFHYI